MPKQRNKAHHLAAAASALHVREEAARRLAIQALLAKRAGATWQEVGDVTHPGTDPEKRRQAAYKKFSRLDTDGERLWSQRTLPLRPTG